MSALPGVFLTKTQGAFESAMKRLLLACGFTGAVLTGTVHAQGVGDESPSSNAALLAELQVLRNRVIQLEAKVGPEQDMREALARLQARVEATDQNGMNVFWKDGLRVEGDGVVLKFGGRIQNDYTFGSGDSTFDDNYGELEDATEFRRARLYFSGKAHDKVEWKAQYDFAGGDADFKDVFMRFLEVPFLADVTVGQQKEPFSLEEQTSSNHITFLERALPNALVPGRSTGIQSSRTFGDKRGTISVGAFKTGTDSFGDASGDGDNAATARVTYTPIHEDEGRRVVHVGGSYSRRGVDDYKVEVRPEIHDMQKVLKTGTLDASNVKLMGLEAAWVEGPFSLQAEAIRSEVDLDAGGSPQFDGSYVQASYFLTGEHRPYKQSTGAFDRVSPLDPYIGKDATGFGAVELAARYSMIDLNDESITAGELDNWTMGVNWYLSRNTRIMLDYIHFDIDGDSDPTINGDGDAVTLRFQTDF